MAVINCPSCRKKISDKAQSCSHCGVHLGELDDDKRQHLKQVTLIKQSQNLMNHSFVAMLLFCGGFLFLYWQEAQPGTWQYIGALISTSIGFILYIVTRIRLIILKRNL